jgi:hypothetical protein
MKTRTVIEREGELLVLRIEDVGFCASDAIRCLEPLRKTGNCLKLSFLRISRNGAKHDNSACYCLRGTCAVRTRQLRGLLSQSAVEGYKSIAPHGQRKHSIDSSQTCVAQAATSRKCQPAWCAANVNPCETNAPARKYLTRRNYCRN